MPTSNSDADKQKFLEELRKPWYCRRCGKPLILIHSMDLFSTVPQSMYCENPQCEDFGYLVVVGVREVPATPHPVGETDGSEQRSPGAG